MERIINAFENGWQAGASLGGARLDQFAAVSPDLQVFWLDGYYAGQARFDSDGPAVSDANEASSASDHVAGLGATRPRPSHPISRALQAAYQAARVRPSPQSMIEMLAKLDLML
jgi:hypothetical protein